VADRSVPVAAGSQSPELLDNQHTSQTKGSTMKNTNRPSDVNGPLTSKLGILAGWVLPRKTVEQQRGYALGERNPAKADVTDRDVAESKAWGRRRKLVEAGRLIGSKY
jgi:hypothetical protein